MPSSAVAFRAEKPLTPAMVSAVWEIAAALDEQRVAATVPNAVWLELSTARLRGAGGRTDNVWLRECLDRLTGVKLSGEVRGDPWGAVVLAEWHIIEGGALARLLIPPAGVHALRSPANFAKIEEHAAHRLTGHARRLYAILADKKRLGRPTWTFTLDELRALLDLTGQRSYGRFNTLRQRVLDPALAAINDYGTVAVSMTPEKRGRSVHAITFRWQWKDPHDAAETAAQSERHSSGRRRRQEAADAPPMIEDAEEAARVWWAELDDDARDQWAERVGRTFEIAGKTRPRPERIVRQMAYETAQADAAPCGQAPPPLPVKGRLT